MIAFANNPMWRRRAEPVEIRPTTPDESEWFLRVLCAGFNLDLSTARRFFYDDPYYEVNQRWGLWIEERGGRTLVSVLTAIPLQIRVGARAIPCYGIAGVATLPEYRRRGYASELLRVVVQALYAEEVPLAILQAFNHEFYRKLGWETVSVIAHARLEPKQLPRYDSTTVRRATPADAPAVQALYAQTVVPRTGSLVRDERRWRYLLWNLPNLWVCDYGGQIEGYLFYDFLDSGWTLRVRELTARTERAQRALLGWLAANEESVRHVEFQMPLEMLASLRLVGWSVPPADPTQPVYTVQIVPNMMARPLHSEALVRYLLGGLPTPEGFQPFNLRVRDPLLAENGEPIGIASEGGTLCVEAGLPTAPTLTLSPTTLALMAFGTLTVPDLHARRILSAPVELLPTLDALFPARAPCLTPIDFF
ncbi:MAG: GNAT family N-acetyltransferase [Fimbriimonadales bacterium]|nr:GNAT family N-acetyltransferase [Fimbriimonadales bacterium]